MNPRLFCRERGLHKSLLLTYSFDPVFFEQIILPDLWAGGSSDILVLGDADQIETAIQMNIGQLWHLGKRYILARAAHAGTFHPKVLLRLGPKDGAVLIGSGNLTSSGWGANQELACAWTIGPGHVDNGAWLPAFFDSMLGWCRGELEAQAIRRMRDIPWLATTVPSDTGSTILSSRPNVSLASALATRWPGRKFDTVHILTGSTDEGGAFLRWAHRTFGITNAIVAVTPAHSSFNPQLLADLPVDLKIIPVTENKPLHAKFYWFQGPDGVAAVMGSANCSAAAWLLAPGSGGNVESVVVFDQPVKDTFADILGVFGEPASAPMDVLTPPTNLKLVPEENHARFTMSGLQWDGGASRFLAWICPEPSLEATVCLLLKDRQYPMTHSGSPSEAFWFCDFPERINSDGTLFAAIQIMDAKGISNTVLRWVDHVSELAHASMATRLVEPIKGLAFVGSPGEQRRMLDELHQVAQMIFNEPGSFQDPIGNVRRDVERKDGNVETVPVDPAALIRHLEEIPSATHAGNETKISGSISGILRLLFDSESHIRNSNRDAAEDENLDEGQDPQDPAAANSTRPGNDEQKDPPVHDLKWTHLSRQISA